MALRFLLMRTERYCFTKITMAKLNQEFREQAIFRMEENTPRVARCLDLLAAEQVWQRPNASSNSIGNLILHLCGNIDQYIYASLGGHPDTRTREVEFSATEGWSKEELLEKLGTTVSRATGIISTISQAELERVRPVQGFDLSGVGIVIHVVEHYSYHTGQIAFWTKLLKDEDLGFYAGIDLNVHNS